MVNTASVSARSIVRPSWVLLVFMACGLEAAASDEAALWVEKMGKALQEQSYSGVYTYMRGRQYDAVRIEHQFLDGEEKERLYHLNGEAREVIREGDRIVCNHLDSENLPADQARLDHAVPMGPFNRMFNENLAAYPELYKFSLHGKGRIADRSVIRMSITPVQNDRYGYRLWLDEQTGLLLQSHLVGKGRVLELFQFIEVSIGEPVAADQLASHAVAGTQSHLLSPDPVSEVRNKAAKPVWQAKWLPRGFRRVSSPRDKNRLLFSDGVATLSVFVERSAKASVPDLSTFSGGTVVFSRQRKVLDRVQQITIVGKIPLETARRVADSIEPAI